MCFVAFGELEYSDMDGLRATSVATEQLVGACFVQTGEWACESCLWADKAFIPNPLVAAEPTEVILVDACEFQKVAGAHETSVSFVAKYAEFFMQRFQAVSKASSMDPHQVGPEVLFN